MLKDRVFDRLSDAGFRIQKKSKSRKASSREALFESSPIIDADFVEVDDFKVDKDSFRNPNRSYEADSGPIDSDLLEKLREYLKTRSEEEISEIFEEVSKIMKSRGSESDFQKASGEEDKG